MKSILWVTDPWLTLDHPKDTTLRLMEESIALKIPTYWADATQIFLENQKVKMPVQKLIKVAPGRDANSFQWGKSEIRAPQDFTQIHYRPDPPVDSRYIYPLQLLAQAITGTRSIIVNPASVLLMWSEKFHLRLPKAWIPETLVSADIDRLLEFAKKLKHVVLKPPHEAQSKGIEQLEIKQPSDQDRVQAALIQATRGGLSPIVLQAFQPGIFEGEKRLWFIDGKLLAVIRKKPISGDFRVQIDQGSVLEAAELNGSEKKNALELGRFLKREKIRLAAVDWINGKITDLNFTSPGLIVQMEKITRRNLAREILKQIF